MDKLHGNIIARSCRALITFKDGTGQICDFCLKNGLTFSLGEMRRWRMEAEGKPIKSIDFLSFEKGDVRKL